MVRIGFDAKRLFHNQTGLGNYSRDIVRILATHYPENEYFLFNPKKSSLPPALNSFANLQQINPSRTFDKLFPRQWRTLSLGEEAKKHKLNVFHGLSGELPVGISNIAGKHTVTIHDLIFCRFPQFYRWIDRVIYKRKIAHACEIADKIIAISQQTKSDLINFFNIEPNKIKVIYQVCNPVFHQDADVNQIDAVRQKFHLPDHFVLSVGTIEERKNLLTTIKALESIPKVGLVVIGQKKRYVEKIFNYIKNKEIRKRITFLSGITMSELACIYKLSSILIYPSFFEGFGIPIIEALFSKVPVITSKGSCFQEAGGPDSRYIDPNNYEDLSLAISDILSNSSQAEFMIKKGLEYVKKFSDAMIAKELNAFYYSLLN